jgi:hypothetical protein
MPSLRPWTPSSSAVRAVSQVASAPATRGTFIRSGELTCVYSKRPRSHIQPSSISSFSWEVTRTSWCRRFQSVTLQPTAHLEQTEGTWSMSQGRDSKRHTRLVRAPTGQRSMMLPENTDLSGWSNWLVMYE